MDLHFTAAEPSAEERDAVDGLLAGLDDAAVDGSANRRQYLLPVLHVLQARVGWISPGGLNHACRRLGVAPAEAFGVADFYALFETRPQPLLAVHVCDDIGCRFQPGNPVGALCNELEKRFGPAGGGAERTVAWHRSPCLGLCERAPAALVIAAGAHPRQQAVAPASADALVAAIAGDAPPPAAPAAAVPQARHRSAEPALPLLGRIGRIDPESLDEYRAAGGFLALRRAYEMGPERVAREVIDAKLVGRGGAAFPTGQKWLSARAAQAPRYLVCNADESEPGTFKDRVLMEGDPYALVEAMAIAGFASGCERGYIYLRGEYPLAAARLANALARCRDRGLLGNDILGQGVRFDVELRRGAGAYICGEEMALLNSIEGHRGEPRNKPPFPTQVGLFGRPTVINNVETLVNVLPIVLGGGKAYAARGTERSTGTRLFCLSGHVVDPGVYEVVMGTTLRELLAMAGGVAGSGRLQAVLLGGAAGAFVGPAELDLPLTLEAARAAGVTLGSGVVMAFDDTVDLGDALRRIAQFFRDESCGQCVPCRVGVVRQEEALARLLTRRPEVAVAQELTLLGEVGQVMRDASICGLGQTASSAIESALAKFPIFQEKS